MRANDLPFPIASYSFGGPRAPASTQLRLPPMRRRYTLTVAGMFATVSAVAIVFGPLRTPTPVASSAELPPVTLAKSEPKAAARPPIAAQISVTLDSFQTAGIPVSQPKSGRAPDPIGGAARRPAVQPSLTQLSAASGAARTVGAALKSDPSLTADPRAAADDVGASSLPSRSIACGSSCSRYQVQEAGADSVDVGMARADIAKTSEASALASGAPIEPVLSSSGGLIAPATAKPLADFTERGVLLVDAQGAAAVQPEEREPAAVVASAASTAMRSEAPDSVGVASAGSPGPGSSAQATLSNSEAVPPSSVTAEGQSSAPAQIALHLDRVKKRYVGAPTSAPLIEQHGRAAAEPAHAQGVASPIGGPQAAESTSSLVVHDNELVAIQLGELISLFEARLDRPLFVWMRSSLAASKFVTAETLAAAGIEAKYNSASKQLVLTVAEE